MKKVLVSLVLLFSIVTASLTIVNSAYGWGSPGDPFGGGTDGGYNPSGDGGMGGWCGGCDGAYYSEGGYYSESSYYSEGSYYGEGSYGSSYGEGGYYGEGTYGGIYSQGSYGGGGGTYSLVGYVYSDNNNNNGQDASDSGIPGEVVQLLNNSNGAVVSQGTANGSGYYSITGIAAGGYTACHQRDPLWPGWTRITARCVVLNIGANSTASFGMKAFMEGYVFHDDNQDTFFNAGESGLWLQTVQLLNNSTGAVTATVQTDANGHYMFSPVPYNAGGYTIYNSSAVPAGWTRTTPQGQVRSMSNFASASFGLDNTSGGGPPTPPPPPGGSFAQNMPTATCGNMRVSWESYPGAVDYHVNYWKNGDPSSSGTGISSSGLTYKDLNAGNGLIPGQSYSFLIEAIDGAGGVMQYSDNGLWSHQVYGIFVTFPNCSPPGAFSQNPPVASCPGNSPQVALSWGAASGAPPMSYHVEYFDSAGGGAQVRPELGNVFSTAANSSWGATMIPGHDYSFIIRAANANGYVYSNDAWSHQLWGYTKYPSCSAPLSQLWINGQPHTGLPVHVNQNAPATLTWQTTNATSSTPSSSPANASWNATNTTANPYGNLSLNTSIPGTYQFTLRSLNGLTTHPASTATITLVVDQFPKPFIQTTEGDIHTNESIYITPNN